MFSQQKTFSLPMLVLGAVLLVCVLGLQGCKRAASFPVKEPLFIAVRDNDVTWMESFLDDGASVNAVSGDGVSLVYEAVGPKGGYEVLAVLIARGADVSKGTKNGRSPLMNAAGWCDIVALEMLLAAGADINYVAPSGLNAARSTCKSPSDLRRQVLTMLFEG